MDGSPMATLAKPREAKAARVTSKTLGRCQAPGMNKMVGLDKVILLESEMFLWIRINRVLALFLYTRPGMTEPSAGMIADSDRCKKFSKKLRSFRWDSPTYDQWTNGYDPPAWWRPYFRSGSIPASEISYRVEYTSTSSLRGKRLCHTAGKCKGFVGKLGLFLVTLGRGPTKLCSEAGHISSLALSTKQYFWGKSRQILQK